VYLGTAAEVPCSHQPEDAGGTPSIYIYTYIYKYKYIFKETHRCPYICLTYEDEVDGAVFLAGEGVPMALGRHRNRRRGLIHRQEYIYTYIYIY
jgi:hypothetical protein